MKLTFFSAEGAWVTEGPAGGEPPKAPEEEELLGWCWWTAAWVSRGPSMEEEEEEELPWILSWKQHQALQLKQYIYLT